jgi:hypothetical protein
VRYRIGFVDDAMHGALAESVADRVLIEVQAIGRNLRRTDDATA